MDKCREAFERHQADLTDTDYEVLKPHFDNNEQYFGSRYNEGSLYERDWFVWEACWKSRQAELDQQKLLTLDSELHLDAAKEEIERLKSVVNEKDKRIEEYKMISESIEDMYLLERKKVEAVEHVLGCAMIAPKEVFQYADRIGRALRGEHE